MSQLKELREKQATLVAEARARLAEISADTPEGRASELETQHDNAMAEFDKLEARAVRLENLEAAEQRLAPRGDRRPNTEDRSENDGDNRDGETRTKDQKALFRRAMQFGLDDMSPEERREIRALQTKLTPEQRAQATTSGAAGGYAIPAGFLPEITKTLALWGPMLDGNLIRLLPTDTGNSLPWPTVNDTANTGEDHAENAGAADQDVTFGQKQLDAYSYDSGVVKVGFELLQDSAFDFETLLDDLFGDRLGRRVNAKLTTGTGTNQPNGIVTASGLGVTAASAVAITADELIDMFHSVDPAYREAPKCGWQFNDSTLKTIRKLKDGQGNYLWAMGDVKSGAPATLLDKPYRINQAMASIATGNRVAIFGDMNKYVTRLVKLYQMLRLNERYAENLQAGFIAWMRADGELSDGAAIKHYKMA